MNKLYADKIRVMLRTADVKLQEMGLEGPPLCLYGISRSWAAPVPIESPYFRPPRSIWIAADFPYTEETWTRMRERVLDCLAHCAVHRDFERQQEVFRTSPNPSRAPRPVRHFQGTPRWQRFRNELSVALV